MKLSRNLYLDFKFFQYLNFFSVMFEKKLNNIKILIKVNKSLRKRKYNINIFSIVYEIQFHMLFVMFIKFYVNIILFKQYLNSQYMMKVSR